MSQQQSCHCNNCNGAGRLLLVYRSTTVLRLLRNRGRPSWGNFVDAESKGGITDDYYILLDYVPLHKVHAAV